MSSNPDQDRTQNPMAAASGAGTIDTRIPLQSLLWSGRSCRSLLVLVEENSDDFINRFSCSETITEGEPETGTRSKSK